MKYNLHEVMSEAWEIYHANKQPGGLRPVFSICLEMAWEHVKNSNILNQWQAMSEQQQINMLTACVKRAAKNEIGYSTEDHYLQYNETVAWFLGYHGLDGLVNEAWLKLADRLDADYLEALNAKRAAAGKVNITLTTLVCIAPQKTLSARFTTTISSAGAVVWTPSPTRTANRWTRWKP